MLSYKTHLMLSDNVTHDVPVCLKKMPVYSKLDRLNCPFRKTQMCVPFLCRFREAGGYRY